MGHRERAPSAMKLAIVFAIACAAGLVFSHPAAADETSSKPEGRVQMRDGIYDRATADLVGRPNLPRVDLKAVWGTRPGGAMLRSDGTLLCDNGDPLDDFGDLPAQLSRAPSSFEFVAALADDFIITDFITPDVNAQITMVRGAFLFFNDGADTATPLNTWAGITVTVYANSGLDAPDGEPLPNGSHVGNVIATQYVSVAELPPEDVLVGSCSPYFVVDIPVDLVLAKNTRYWMSLVPDSPALPQTAWCFSDANAGFVAQRGFPFLGIPFWQELLTTESNCGCPTPWENCDACPPECENAENPPGGFARDLAFQIYGSDLSLTTGACCDVSTGVCTDDLDEATCLASSEFAEFRAGVICQFAECEIITGACCDDATVSCADDVNIADCTGVTERFVPYTACIDMDPPCGTTDPGACCLPEGTCLDLTPLDCSQTPGGVWHAGECSTFDCPPANDDCEDAISLLTAGAYFINTTGATTDGPMFDPSPPPGCVEVESDVWFRYSPDCDGTMFVSFCLGANFDTALAVYNDCFCPLSTTQPLACDNDTCDDQAEVVVSNVLASECYLIRVGGAAGATGQGVLVVACLPTGTGACCHFDGTCENLLPEDCSEPDDVFTPNLPCELVYCPEPAEPAKCCPGDTNLDGLRDGLDIQGFINYMLDPPVLGTLEFCHADVDENLTIDEDDIGPFVQLLLDAEECPILCCAGDFNGDGVLNGPDIQGLVDAVLAQPIPGTESHCLADLNEDNALDELDVALMVQTLLEGVDIYCPPDNDFCPNAIEIFDGDTAFTTLGATTDGPAHPGSGCETLGDGGLVEQDVWYFYTATTSGNLSISACNDMGATTGYADFDLRIAVYDTCSCRSTTDATLIGCTDDNLNCADGSSELIVPVVQDACYLIRIGGTADARGSGVVSIGYGGGP